MAWRIILFFLSYSQTVGSSNLCNNGMIPESHSGDRYHGDVCRRAKDNGFQCPDGCETSPTAPYCLQRSTEKVSTHPCRLLTMTSSPCQMSYKLEMHSTTPTHGDICRSIDKSTFVCPNTCQRVDGEPYCSGGVESNGEHIPCRIHFRFNASRMTSSFAARTVDQSSSSMLSSACNREDLDKAKKVVLVRFTMEASHGDICRSVDETEGSFFCPFGCVRISSPPYCSTSSNTTSTSTSLIEPCRVPPETVSRIDRLSARVLQLIESRNRLSQMGDEQGASRADLNLRLVKHDLRKEKLLMAKARKTSQL